MSNITVKQDIDRSDMGIFEEWNVTLHFNVFQMGINQDKSRGFLLHSLINTQSSMSLSGNSIYRGFVQEEWVLLAPRAQASPIAI